MAKAQEIQLKALSDNIGDFIRYWGFRRIHGQIWAQVYLSKIPLSPTDLTKRLKVSKALVSKALSELMSYDLLRCYEVNGKSKMYSANPDVYSVIRKILRDREQSLIKSASKNFDLLQASNEKMEASESVLDLGKLKDLGELISSANVAIHFIIGTANSESVAEWSSVSDLG